MSVITIEEIKHIITLDDPPKVLEEMLMNKRTVDKETFAWISMLYRNDFTLGMNIMICVLNNGYQLTQDESNMNPHIPIKYVIQNNLILSSSSIISYFEKENTEYHEYIDSLLRNNPKLLEDVLISYKVLINHKFRDDSFYPSPYLQKILDNTDISKIKMPFRMKVAKKFIGSTYFLIEYVPKIIEPFIKIFVIIQHKLGYL